jgi:hypothetical protein
MTRIRWVFDDAIAYSPALSREYAESLLGEVGHYGMTIDPETGMPGEGLEPRRAVLETDW